MWAAVPSGGHDRVKLKDVPTVLIVDDHPSFRTFARELLELTGFEVVGEAADGAAAIAAVARLRPDVVLLDVQLPDLDGFEVAARLKGSGAAVVLTSSRGARDHGARLRAAAAHGFIPKEDLTGAALRAVLAA